MKKQFQIRYNYSADATTIDIALSPHFRALMAEASAICLAYSHAEGSLNDSSPALEVLQKLAFDHAAESTYGPTEMGKALVLVCRAALYYAAQGRGNDDLARVIVMLAQATPCTIAKIKLPERQKLRGGKHLSEIASASYEILRRQGPRALEVPIFAAYQLSFELSELKRLPKAVQYLLVELQSEIQLFVVALARLGALSAETEKSKALEEAMRN